MQITIFGIPLFLLLLLNSSFAHIRKHHKRSLENDPRSIGFSFENQPTRNTTSFGPQLLECSYILAHEKSEVQAVRVEWRRDGVLVNEKANSRIKISVNGSLWIENMSNSEEGTYQCAVHVTTTREGQTETWTFLSRKALLKMADLAKFDTQPIDRNIAKGQPTAFHCLTSASKPSPSVSWYHNDKLIENKDGGEYHILPLSNTLEISSTQTRHEGTYRCAIEGAGKRRSSQTGRLSISTGEVSNDLVFISSPRLQVVELNDDILLECLVSSKTRPQVRWLKDSRQIIVDGTRVRRVGVSSILISKAIPDDTGLYTCRASNNDDSIDRAVSVEVRTPPKITTLPMTKIAVETADVDLECVAAGRPETTISWFKNGEAIIASEYFVIEPNRLRILGVVRTDQGVYQCLAENAVGSEQASAQLLVDAPDSSAVAASSGQPMVASSPLGLRISTVGSRFINIEWDRPVQSNGNIMRYHVFYKESGSDRERMINSSTTSTTLSSLQPSTLYLIRVAAENEAGMGKTSDNLKVSTSKEQAVPGKISSLSAIATGAETIEIKWSPPTGGQPALRYKIYYSKDPPEKNEKETLITTSFTTYTLHGMGKYTDYQIRVEAEGGNGSGLSSDVVKVRTLSDEPSAPPQNIQAEADSSTSVRVSWEEPDGDSVNGEITGYRLKYKTKARGSKGNTFVIDASAREYTMGNLESNTQYLVRLAVVNHNGTGPFSDWINVDTPGQDKEERTLGAPREIRPHAGIDYIVVSWLPPIDEQNLVRGYQVGWGLSVPDTETARVSASTTQYKIPRLHSGRDYVISLRAFNNFGAGFPIYETVRTLSRDVVFGGEDASENEDEELVGEGESTPVGVRAEAISATSIRVIWTEADETSFNTLYTVRYSTSVDGNQHRYVNSTETWATIEGLRPATEYEFAVRAISNGFSLSAWSMATRNRTQSAPPSSAPRDLTVLPAESGDPHSASLHWQPPKYSNGEIEEYLVYYTDRSSLADKDWIINYVAGDKLSHQVSNLLPKANYFFKIQARNEKGHGPFSSVVGYTPSGGAILSGNNNRRGYGTSSNGTNRIGIIDHLKQVFAENPLYLLLLIALILILFLSLILILMCCFRRSSAVNKNGYQSAKKTSQNGVEGAPNDLWINGAGSHMRAGTSDYMVDGLATAHLTAVDIESPTPRYHHLQDSVYGSIGGRPPRPERSSRTPMATSMSSAVEDEEIETNCLIAKNVKIERPMARVVSIAQNGIDVVWSQGTLTRSYHQSSQSLEGARQRTPQVVYTGTGRHQPIHKIDFCESPYGSSSAIGSAATPPLPMQAPPSGPPTVIDGYRTLRGTPPSSANALRSFTQLAGATPPPPPVVPGSTPRIIQAGGRQVPVGRATAQPRVNVANIYSPYASCSSENGESEKASGKNGGGADSIEMRETPTKHVERNINMMPSNSTEELNAQMESLDTMIDDLQQLQHAFQDN
ncbi:unnamed protein product [Caenorhabditis angaria]|uniref:Uncharacterized protein n=1 Tax=Caenorhabditis angaria TaxID=860376 RepID=A0A9P1MRY9_9PELO|nr:unnamed protein product [Caenorhabditis angaria]